MYISVHDVVFLGMYLQVHDCAKVHDSVSENERCVLVFITQGLYKHCDVACDVACEISPVQGTCTWIYDFVSKYERCVFRTWVLRYVFISLVMLCGTVGYIQLNVPGSMTQLDLYVCP